MRETATGRLQYHHRIIQVASGRPRSGSLLAARRGNHLIYVGSVGTGLKESDAWRLRAMMDKLLTKKPPLAYEGRRKYVVGLQPRAAVCNRRKAK
ncbi:ATP dependent DNA ligase C terminal region family protein [Rhizobium leguminosarum bv. viciae]|nr:ATP dependent DNA ligase C terminal region family protein [Rhizobium leguminosarum bv. viciae]